MTSLSNLSEMDEAVFSSLTQWIGDAGGHVHPSLSLCARNGIRGVAASNTIAKGELLVRVPAKLVICGEEMPGQDSVGKGASPWLRCLAALLKAKSQAADGSHEPSTKPDTVDFLPYLKSLPSHFEHLMNWSEDEVDSFLRGTALGQMAQADRGTQALQTRYNVGVQPYLEQIGIVHSKDSPCAWEEFRNACMCLSTRGFHHYYSEKAVSKNCVSTGAATSYNGPFLLPFIDLLNHSSQKKCTTLQREPSNDGGGAFYMTAERNIDKDEELFHSYGDDLTSGQLLQTFGFVLGVKEAAGGREFCADNTTPATLSKDKVIKACQSVAASSFPTQLREIMESHKMPDESWSLPEQGDVDCRDDLSLIPNEILIPLKEPLVVELVTLCCLMFIPKDAYDDWATDDPALLDKSVLDDYFLGRLVCQSVLLAAKDRLAAYGSFQLEGFEEHDGDKDILSKLCDLPSSQVDTHRRRATYGLTVRREEKACIQALVTEVSQLSDEALESGDDSQEDLLSSNKRPKLL